MTMTSESRRSMKRPMIAAIVGAGVVTAGVIAVLVANGGDDGPASDFSPAAQVASIEHGCQEWVNQPGGASMGEDVCTGLGSWMSDELGSAGMGPQAMWGSPDRLEAMCRQWSEEHPGGTGAAGKARGPAGPAWCGSMVTWMSDHMQDWTGHQAWGEWMSKGPMDGH